MKRWNGWGDETVTYPLPADGLAFLENRVGRSKPPKDASLDDVVAKVPKSRLTGNLLVRCDAAERLRHARGQSLPDWISMRTGSVDTFPDGVAHPADDAEVKELLEYARKVGAAVIPYGGGTSVVGHINPTRGDRPVLTVSMDRMTRLRDLDERSQLATFDAGVTGPALEEVLRAHNYTLGHFPQSFEYSTLGGWIATRSSGQESAHYGRIEKMFAGGRVITPLGDLELPPFPASAAGPDLREMLLGSEGRMGIISQATVRVQPRPEQSLFRAAFFPDWSSAFAAAREIAQERVAYAMLRVSTPTETSTMLALAGHKRLTSALEWVLSVRGAAKDKCMMLLGFNGDHGTVSHARRRAIGIVRKHDGIHVGKLVGEHWMKSRFRSPYLRNALWDAGYAIDTLETATTWARVPNVLEAVESALRTGLEEDNERTHVFTHLSHVYPSGSSVYTTYLFRLGANPKQTLARWKKLKDAASRAIVDQVATISHQHGVGIDHIPYLIGEKGKLGMGALSATMKYWDPKGIMNPGKLC